MPEQTTAVTQRISDLTSRGPLRSSNGFIDDSVNACCSYGHSTLSLDDCIVIIGHTKNILQYILNCRAFHLQSFDDYKIMSKQVSLVKRSDSGKASFRQFLHLFSAQSAKKVQSGQVGFVPYSKTKLHRAISTWVRNLGRFLTFLWASIVVRSYYNSEKLKCGLFLNSSRVMLKFIQNR